MNNISYSEDFELLLKQEAEKAEAMSILHSKSYEKYNTYSVSINVPVIIFSTIVGFLSPINLGFPNQTMLLGGISILIAILKTVDSYFDFTKRCETHRITSLNYGKISKLIQLQLSLEKECRINANDIYTIINSDLQNIREAEPLISEDVIKSFNIKYKDEKTAKPACTNGLTDIKINKSSKKSDFILQIERSLPQI
jgi:hypothetical protein